MLRSMHANQIKLINCDLPLIKAVLQGDDHLADYLEVEVPNPWTEFGRSAFEYVIKKVERDPDVAPWWTWLPILEDKRILVGSCGYKGKPDETGAIEIGYEVSKGFRGRGIATQIATKLVERAWGFAAVKTILAHTLAEKNASCRVLEKCGFSRVDELDDPMAGMVWRWKISRES
ncbi:MAG: GNAT family N-acetyltransferase [Bacteroidetes bacterium]|nr:GNAT family N-acetyltransferase [Bacteroidota bacterium]